MAFSPDGRMLASGFRDGTVVVWDARQRRRLEELAGHTGPVYSVAFGPDGRTLASGGSDGTVVLWDLRLDSWRQRACAIANRNLTQAEWDQFIGPEQPYRRTCRDVPPRVGASPSGARAGFAPKSSPDPASTPPANTEQPQASPPP